MPNFIVTLGFPESIPETIREYTQLEDELKKEHPDVVLNIEVRMGID